MNLLKCQRLAGYLCLEFLIVWSALFKKNIQLLYKINNRAGWIDVENGNTVLCFVVMH